MKRFLILVFVASVLAASCSPSATEDTSTTQPGRSSLAAPIVTTTTAVDRNQLALSTARNIDPSITLDDVELSRYIDEYVKTMDYAAANGISWERTMNVMIGFHTESEGLSPEDAALRIIALTAGSTQVSPIPDPGHQYAVGFLDWATVTPSDG